MDKFLVTVGVGLTVISVFTVLVLMSPFLLPCWVVGKIAEKIWN
jgi:hypothetical protein